LIRAPRGRALAATVAAAALALGLAACGDDGDDGADTVGPDESPTSGKIALLLPESRTARYEMQDRPNFERRVAELCLDCEIIYANAEQDAAAQWRLAEAALASGAQVMVLDPVDPAAAGAIVSLAKAQDVPVISYDRLIADADIDLHISFDDETVGELQAQALLDALTGGGNGDGTIVMINGPPTDDDARLLRQGAHAVLDSSTLTIGAEHDTARWSPDEARREMDEAITRLGRNGFVGVHAASDGTGGGAIAAMKAAGIDPSTRPVTGQGAELAALRRILAGEQLLTVYTAYKAEAEAAAEAAVGLLSGTAPETTTTIDNGLEDVPSIILEPIAVTKENIADTVIADGLWTADQICTADVAPSCAEAGIQ
jgi:D-xylose transport system substrate-binding protein